jgi:hypothetical protein
MQLVIQRTFKLTEAPPTSCSFCFRETGHLGPAIDFPHGKATGIFPSRDLLYFAWKEASKAPF